MASNTIRLRGNPNISERKFVGTGASEVVLPGMLVKEASVTQGGTTYNGYDLCDANEREFGANVIVEQDTTGRGLDTEYKIQSAAANVGDNPSVVVDHMKKGDFFQARVKGGTAAIVYAANLDHAAEGCVASTTTAANGRFIAQEAVDASSSAATTYTRIVVRVK